MTTYNKRIKVVHFVHPTAQWLRDCASLYARGSAISQVSRRTMTPLLAFVLLSLLSGCEVLVPRKHESIPVEPAQTNAIIISAVQKSIRRANFPYAGWTSTASFQSETKGVVEFGPCRQSNITGYCVRAKIDRRDNVVDLTVKGVGPYYSDLNVSEAARRLRLDIEQRLAAELPVNPHNK